MMINQIINLEVVHDTDKCKNHEKVIFISCCNDFGF